MAMWPKVIQSQCNAHQNANVILQRTRRNNPRTGPEPERTMNSHSSERNSTAGGLIAPGVIIHPRVAVTKTPDTGIKTDDGTEHGTLRETKLCLPNL